MLVNDSFNREQQMKKIQVNPTDDTVYGLVEVPRGWSDIFSVLLDDFDLDYHGFPNKPSPSNVTETDKFIINPYYDSDCDCSSENANMACEHDENCSIVRPNFLYKPTGFKLYWYKYPMRSSEMVPGLTAKQFMAIIMDCMEK
jgi:hypothetical protein